MKGGKEEVWRRKGWRRCGERREGGDVVKEGMDEVW